MSGRSSQAKGRRAERELAALFQQHGYDVRPGSALNYGTEPDLLGLENIHIECKRRENVNLSAALAQAEADSRKFGDGLPAVFHRANRKPWTVSMPLDAWLQLYQKAQAKTAENRSSYQAPADSNHKG